MVEMCIHVANVFYLLSYLGRDMLWLRILTCLGLVLGIFFFTCQPTPLYAPTAWHLVFLVINGYQIRSLIRERRELMLSQEQEKLGTATFHDLSREELLTLLTRVVCEDLERVGDLHQASHQQLTKDEQVLRNLAFSRLSRNELLNLLTRRMWNSLARRNPVRPRRRGHQAREAAVEGPATGVARSHKAMSAHHEKERAH